ncbi:hypothetical protein WDW89_18350 [Deltaproteobacteria bacterium TL4]
MVRADLRVCPDKTIVRADLRVCPDKTIVRADLRVCPDKTIVRADLRVCPDKTIVRADLRVCPDKTIVRADLRVCPDKTIVRADLRVCPDKTIVRADLRVCPDKTGEHIGSPLRDETTAILGEPAPILGEHIGSPLHAGEHIGSPLHAVVQWFKTMTTNEYIRGVKSYNWQPFNKRIWQRNYYEHIIRNENEYNRIAQYIMGNPQTWGDDQLNNGTENMLMESRAEYGVEPWMV